MCVQLPVQSDCIGQTYFTVHALSIWIYCDEAIFITNLKLLKKSVSLNDLNQWDEFKYIERHK